MFYGLNNVSNKRVSNKSMSNKRVSLLAVISAIVLLVVGIILGPVVLGSPEKEITSKPSPTLTQENVQAAKVRSKKVVPENSVTILEKSTTGPENSTTSPENRTASSPSYVDHLKASDDKNSFHEALLKDHDEQNRYQSFNQKIPTIEQDPTERRYELDVRTVESENGEAALTLWTDKKYYLHGDQVVIYVSLEDARGVPIRTDFVGQLLYNETENMQQFTFTDSNQDGIYEYQLTLGQSNGPSMSAGVYKVLVANQASDIVDAVTFILSQPDLALTGEFKDLIDTEKNLLIETQIEVAAEHRYYFQASLYSSTNDPIGVTQYSGTLSPGLHWIPLEFDGLMIRDADEPGPYLLKSLSMAKVTLPMQRAPLIFPEYYTQGYNVDQFGNTN